MEPEEERRVVQSAKPFDRGRCRAVAAPLELYAVVVHVEADRMALDMKRSPARTARQARNNDHRKARGERKDNVFFAALADFAVFVRELLLTGRPPRQL